jgi:putative transcriptional regulator
MGSRAPVGGAGNDNFLEGKLLIAMPGMPDPRFERSVIFMCAHSASGAVGIIVNKPFEGLAFRELMAKLNIKVTSNRPGGPILYGGPVETGRGFVVHSGEFSVGESTMPVTDQVSLTGSIDILAAIAEGRGPERSIFALGHAGWGPGQIEHELSGNGWIHCDIDEHILFDDNHDTKWSAALAKLGIDISGLSVEIGRA